MNAKLSTSAVHYDSTVMCFLITLSNIVYSVWIQYLLTAGQSGLGKSTLLNCLFLTELYGGDYPGPSNRIKKTLTVCL